MHNHTPMTLPLAVYTANHGLEWKYPSGEIPYSELDCIRKVFGRLPDFDSGEKGFEGVYVTSTRCFIARCFCALKWDFKGRNAVYLVATWVDRKDLELLDFCAVLSAAVFSRPMEKPPYSFMVECNGLRPDMYREAVEQRLHDKSLAAFAVWRETGSSRFSHREWKIEPPQPPNSPGTTVLNSELPCRNEGVLVPKHAIIAYLSIVAILVVLAIWLTLKAWPQFGLGDAGKPAEEQSAPNKPGEQAEQSEIHSRTAAEADCGAPVKQNETHQGNATHDGSR